ncbi:Uncharacterised protein [Leminorella richardii]|uniref:Lipoprotein n=1 Tax=Leminorella richardii TaxID=158841 RepID=A0A2X4UM41_9GAMM|nr:hypothetical protein [Leminorella richardii]SQI35632.1 Uncharacterised protein [Leminorella richardii]
MNRSARLALTIAALSTFFSAGCASTTFPVQQEVRIVDRKYDYEYGDRGGPILRIRIELEKESVCGGREAIVTPQSMGLSPEDFTRWQDKTWHLFSALQYVRFTYSGCSGSIAQISYLEVCSKNGC